MAQTIEKMNEPRASLVPASSGTALTPMEMLATALEKGQSPDIIDKFMSLAERWEANQSRKAFFEAFAAFKSEAITIARTKKITDGPLKGKSYAELFSFVDAVTPALSRNGLSASWEITKDEKDWIEVTCKIEHVSGHSKTVAQGGPPDAGGAKNAIQARVSTATYLKRETLKAACGIAEQGEDHDGRTPGAAITQEQADKLVELLEVNGKDRAKFLKWAGVEKVTDIAAANYQACTDAITLKVAR